MNNPFATLDDNVAGPAIPFTTDEFRSRRTMRLQIPRIDTTEVLVLCIDVEVVGQNVEVATTVEGTPATEKELDIIAALISQHS